MILRKGRFALVAGFVVFAAFVVGLGTLFIGAQPASHPRSAVMAAGRHSGDDGGFSVVLTEPTEAYLVGLKRIVIEPQIPPGDSVVGVDFFVDGRLVSTDRRAPYATEINFGQEIKRHTIIVTALTAGGRRAKVSFVSRAADLEGDAAVPLALVPAVVRDGRGHLVDGLSVGDFEVIENGARLPIVHFDDDPVPQSIAVTIQSEAPEETRGALLHGAASFADSLLSFDAIGLVTVGAIVADARPARPVPLAETKKKDAPGAVASPPLPAAAFSFDHALFEERLSGLDGGDDRPHAAPLAEALQEATRGLQSRPRGRVLLLLVSGPGPREAEAAILPAPDTTPVPAAPAVRQDTTPPAADQELPAALEALKRSGATLHVVVYGGTENAPFPQIKKAAEETGGEFLVAASAEAVDAACRRIAESLLHQYLVSFAPGSPDREGWRTIELRLRRSDLAVQARRIYFASQPPKRP